MDNWIALVKANMKDRKVTQDELAQRLGMSQGGIGHWLNKRRVPSLADMNRVLAELGLGYLEVALEIRERAAQVPEREAHYNPYFRYPVSDWKQACELREERAPYSTERYELTDYHARGEAFWLPVTGDAMTAPTGMSIAAGMMILVDPAIAPEPGRLVVAQWAGTPRPPFADCRKKAASTTWCRSTPLTPRCCSPTAAASWVWWCKPRRSSSLPFQAPPARCLLPPFHLPGRTAP